MSKQKQKKVIREMLVNGGYVKPAMEKAEYSDAYSKNPQKLTATKSFQELLDKVMPDSLLTEKHKALLNAQKIMSANVYASGKEGKPVNDFIEVDDNQTQIKAVELGYKIKDKMPTSRTDLTSKGEKIASIFATEDVINDLSDNNSDKETNETIKEN